MKALLVVAVLLQITVALQSEGLVKALAELSAFLLVVTIASSTKQQKRQSLELGTEKR
ncbi:hypothetical protein [Vibrio brasiliensis]